MKKPLLAITMGDPAGIGPEIAIKALNKSDKKIIIIGDFKVLKEENVLPQKPLHKITNTEDYLPGKINVLDIPVLNGKVTKGKVDAACGKAAFEYIKKGIELALEKKIDAIITNPINKESLKKAGINYPGHTEMFADFTNTKNFSMLFKLDDVTVTHVTTHCSLKEAMERITTENVFKNIELLNNTLLSMGYENPKIAVGGLNPHAGENGLFGNEEIKEINPAIEKALQKGMNLFPTALPPDTVFMRAFKGEFQGVVSMLHDHGFVALKSRDFEKGVNITSGLPIIRTSVGHGTAFDIAGKNQASEQSLLNAIETAEKMAYNKLKSSL